MYIISQKQEITLTGKKDGEIIILTLNISRDILHYAPVKCTS
jgi:hypothetical protein